MVQYSIPPALRMHTLKKSPTLGLILLAYLAFIALGLPDGLLGVGWPSMRADFSVPLDALGMLLVTGTSGYDIATINYGLVPQPLMIDIGNLFAREVPTATTQAVFDVRLSQSQEADITFDYTTVEGTAVPGQDYLSASGSVTIPSGSASVLLKRCRRAW